LKPPPFFFFSPLLPLIRPFRDAGVLFSALFRSRFAGFFLSHEKHRLATLKHLLFAACMHLPQNVFLLRLFLISIFLHPPFSQDSAPTFFTSIEFRCFSTFFPPTWCSESEALLG